MENLVIYFYVVSLGISHLKLQAAFGATVTLSPSVAEVVEKENVSLSCSYNGTEQQTSSWWIRSTVTNLNPTIFISHGKCNASGYLSSGELFGWNCLGNSTFTLILKKVGRNQHGEKWKCIQNYIQSNEIEIFVKIPLQFVRINTMNISTITRLENSTVQFTCRTSYSRPGPAITWFLDAGTSNQSKDDIILFGNITQNIQTNDTGLVSLVSTIRLNINRTVNGWSVYCLGSNIPNRTALISKATQFNIIYPPDGPPAITGYRNGSVYTVIEGQTGTLSCFITGGNPLADLTWNCYGSSGALDKSHRKVQILLTWRASRDQNDSCQCISRHNSTENISVSVDIDVLYPPSRPVLSIALNQIQKILNTIVNKSLFINCTSNSNPLPKYIWNSPDSSTSLDQLLHIENITEAGSGMYNCTAENHMFSSERDNVTGSNTTSIEINVLFPPSVPVFRYENTSGNVIKNNAIVVVENDTFSVACISTANPEPQFQWKGEITQHKILTISSISADVNKTCYATNVMNETIGESRIGSIEAILSVIVIYPPRKPIIKYSNSYGHERNCSSFNLSVVEKSSFTLSCVAISRPEPSYSWYGPITSTNADLKMIDINREQNGKYSCNAFNVMKGTFGSSESGKNTKEMYLNVLYPPTVSHISNQTVLEGSPLNISCPVNSGNPGQSTIIWTRNGDSKQWNTNTLQIDETHRKDDMIYTCNVYNQMQPSCENETIGQASRSFQLNIVYRASIKTFYVNGLVGQSEVTVNENDLLTFSCLTESNPKSSMKIVINEKVLISQQNVNTLTYTNITATCLHDGIYKCFGSNTYNNEESSVKHVTLRVNCFPRPSPNVQVRDVVYSIQHESVTLSFKALAYPVPDESSFIWQRQIGLMWSTLAYSNRIKISTRGLQTNLTIVNVTKSDFGKYRLSIENAIGIYEQIFYLATKGKPFTPREIEIIPGSITETSVSLQWRPGSDGGVPQIFVIKYRKPVDIGWTNLSFSETDDHLQRQTIHNLTAGTKYKLALLSTNRYGTSAESETITFQTKDTSPDEPEEESSTFIGLLTGLTISVMFHIILIILVIHLWKKRFDRGHLIVQEKATKKTAKLRHSYQSFIDQAGLELTEVSTRRTQLKKQTGKGNVSEAKLDLYEEIKTPGLLVSHTDNEKSASEDKSIHSGKTDAGKHTNPTDYMNLEELLISTSQEVS